MSTPVKLVRRSDIQLTGAFMDRTQGKSGVSFVGPLRDGGVARLLARSDDLSAYDVLCDQPIPFMGLALNQMAVFEFNLLAKIVRNHLISGDIDEIADLVKDGISPEDRALLRGRCMLVNPAAVFPVEWVPRGWLVGSAERQYERFHRWVCGILLAEGLQIASELPEKIVTPATKASLGKKDINIPITVADHILDVWLAARNISSPTTASGLSELTEQLVEVTLATYECAGAHAKGLDPSLIILDGKDEFGFLLDAEGNIVIGADGKPILMLCDEAFTPAAARWVLASELVEGQNPKFYDKQTFRDWLQEEFEAGRWNKKAPMIKLPDELIERGSRRYVELHEMVTGKELVV